MNMNIKEVILQGEKEFDKVFNVGEIIKGEWIITAQPESIKNFIITQKKKLIEAVVKMIDEKKPTALGRHQTYCLYRKESGIRDLWECDCEMIEYTKALSDIKEFLTETLKEL